MSKELSVFINANVDAKHFNEAWEEASANNCSLGMGTEQYIDVFMAIGLGTDNMHDRDLSAVFAEIHGDIVRYVPEWGKFAVYNGRLWQVAGGAQIVDQIIKEFVKGVQVYFYTALCPLLEDDGVIEKTMRKVLAYNDHQKRVSLREDLKSELLLSSAAFNQNPHLLNVWNATIDFSGGIPIVREHDPRDYCTFITPIEYDEHATCPLFVQTLRQCLEENEELEKFVQKVFGLIVAGDTSRDFFIFVGTTNRSGKGTVWNALYRMLGDKDEETGYAVGVMPETFGVNRNANSHGPSSDRARLKGKRLILTSEFREKIELDTVFLKRCTGGDPIAARKMRQNEEQFMLSGIIVMQGNEFPTLDDPSIFGSERAVCIPFDRHFPEGEQDHSLRSRLCEQGEQSGLLNWAIEGYSLVQKEGFEKPDAVKNKTAEFLRESDQVGAYVSQRLAYSRGRNVSAADVFRDYENWCIAGNNGAAVGRNEFYKDLRQYVNIADYGVIDGVRKRSVIRDHVIVTSANGS